jgi:NADPH:quinone reductase-like Zn-dependent oxidoreductase
MATQTGIYVTAPNEPYTIVSTIPRPVPGPKQVLVKSLVTGINPVSVTSPTSPFLSLPPFPSPQSSIPPSPSLLYVPLTVLPREPIMHRTGSNIISPFPAVIGCEASGVVLEVGGEVTRFRPGDGIFGCTRVGQSAYATFQEAFLMDEAVAFKRPEGMSAEEGSTLGVAIMVSLGFGVVGGRGGGEDRG